MPVPKRKVSKSKKKMRRRANSAYTLPQLVPCPTCGEKTLPHRVCPKCGQYKEEQILTTESYV